MAFKEEQEVAEGETKAGAEAEANLVDTSEAAALESADDIDLADRMQAGREQIIAEVRKLIIGQEEVIEQMLLSTDRSPTITMTLENTGSSRM